MSAPIGRPQPGPAPAVAAHCRAGPARPASRPAAPAPGGCRGPGRDATDRTGLLQGFQVVLGRAHALEAERTCDFSLRGRCAFARYARRSTAGSPAGCRSGPWLVVLLLTHTTASAGYDKQVMGICSAEPCSAVGPMAGRQRQQEQPTSGRLQESRSDSTVPMEPLRQAHYVCLPLLHMENRIHTPQKPAPMKPHTPSASSQRLETPPTLCITIDEPMIRAAVITPTTSRFAARFTCSPKPCSAVVSTFSCVRGAPPAPACAGRAAAHRRSRPAPAGCGGHA